MFRTKDIKSSFIEQILNNENLDFKKYGAGNDLLFALIIAFKYKYVKTINEVSSFFRAHPNSFSVANNLIIYYEYSKWYLITNYFEAIKRNYKCKLSLVCKTQIELTKLNDCRNEKVSFFNLLFFRIKRRLKLL